MIKLTVSRHDNIYECFPDVARTLDGTLVCVYRESMMHAPFPFSRLVVRRSRDNGMNWSERQILLECVANQDRIKENSIWLEHDAIAGYEESRARIEDDALIGASINCPRLISLQNGTLLLISDLCVAWLDDHNQWENWLWRSKDNGVTWEGPQKANSLDKIVPSLTQLRNGDLLLGLARETDIVSFIYRSSDEGRTWSEPMQLPFNEDYMPDEISFVELDDGTIVGFGRNYAKEKKRLPSGGIKIISRDGGKTWDGPFDTWLMALEGRPKAGLLRSGEVCITYRCDMPNEMLAMHVMSQAAAESEKIGEMIKRMPVPEDTAAKMAEEKGEERSWYMTSYYPGRTIILDCDRSVHRDGGYSGWVQLDNGDIYVVDYINDDAPLAHIRGYIVSRADIILFPEGDLPWLHPSSQPFRAITRGLADQQTKANQRRMKPMPNL